MNGAHMKQGGQSCEGESRRRAEKAHGRKVLGEANLGGPNFTVDVVGGVANLMGGVVDGCSLWQQRRSQNDTFSKEAFREQ